MTTRNAEAAPAMIVSDLDGTFLSPDGSGCGGELRVTDIYGEQLAVPAVPVKPDLIQGTGLQFAAH